MATSPLVLASSSPYRKALLDRLGLDYLTASPDIDESALPGESPDALVQRLAEQKARAVAGSCHGLSSVRTRSPASTATFSASRVIMHGP